MGETAYVYEPDPDERPSEAVIAGVADVTGQSPLEMDLLPEVIDPDALDILVATAGECASSITVTFEYCGCHVAVTPNDIRITR